MLEKGLTVGLGSDSVASNNACDILEEARFASLVARNRNGRSRFLSSRDVLEMATIEGAKGLKLDDKVGSLEKGKQADIAVVRRSHRSNAGQRRVAHTGIFVEFT